MAHIVEAFDVIIPADDVDASEAIKTQKKLVTRGFIFGSILILIVVAVAVVAVKMTREPVEVADASAPPNNPSGVPSSTPSNSPSTFRSTILADWLVNVFEIKGLQERNSPQQKALTWNIDDDTMQLHESDVKFIQRFALAVLYFATNGENWSSTNVDGKKPFLSGISECNWRGIICNAENEVIIIYLGNYCCQSYKSMHEAEKISLFVLIAGCTAFIPHYAFDM
mmetsp:Transcript_25672/g.37810  ORF Transcript_25672/g.37810 Transcript_25672/m.37810 type:complete len:225 (-) Transcript_25672:1108-1782(-)